MPKAEVGTWPSRHLLASRSTARTAGQAAPHLGGPQLHHWRATAAGQQRGVGVGGHAAEARLLALAPAPQHRYQRGSGVVPDKDAAVVRGSGQVLCGQAAGAGGERVGDGWVGMAVALEAVNLEQGSGLTPAPASTAIPSKDVNPQRHSSRCRLEGP